MGQPGGSDTVTIRSMEQTRGTETSQYPEEKKTKVIARVVASESAGAQTDSVAMQRSGLKDRRQRYGSRLGERPGKAGHSG